MASSRAFPIRGQAERVRFQFFVASTDAPFAGSLTGLSAMVSKDDGAFAPSAGTLTQIGSSSWAYLDLTASEMTAGSVVLEATCSNSGVVAAGLEIVPLDLSAQTARYDLLPDVRFERLSLDLHDYLYNRTVRDGAAMAVYNALGFIKAQGTVVEGDASADKGKLV